MEQIQIEARGLTFDALAAGPQDGTGVMLLHGLPRTNFEWHNQMPVLAEAGFRVVAPNMRGYSPRARPEGVEAYSNEEFAQDVIAMADVLGWTEEPFHLVGTSIAATVAWHVAAYHPDRLATLTAINIPHPQAMMKTIRAKVGKQREKINYVKTMREEGFERRLLADDSAGLRRLLGNMGASDTVQVEPFVEALSDEDTLRCVYNWYRANTGKRAMVELPRLRTPTLFVWPPGASNVSREAAEANADFIDAPFRLEVLEDVRNLVVQAAPDAINKMLLEHFGQQ